MTSQSITIEISSDEEEIVEMEIDSQAEAEPLPGEYVPIVLPRTGSSLQATNLFITYPKCTASKETVMLNIGARLKPKFAIVAAELHKDGTPHLHCVIKLQKRRRIPHSVLDGLAGKHGNYQSARDLLKVISYVVKGNQYVSFGIDVPVYLAKSIRHESTKKRPLRDQVAAKVREGATLDEIDDMLPGYFMMNKRKIQEYVTWISLKRQREDKLKWEGIPLATRYSFPEECLIMKWLVKNIKEKRKFKQKQLWIFGSIGTGKTSLVVWLEKYLSIYWIPHESFDDFYLDGRYDLAVCDEFRGTRMITWMNEFVQGSSMAIRKKGCQGMKRQNIPVIILSNFSIQEAYSDKVSDYAKTSLKARFKEICIPDGEIISFYNAL